MWVMWAGFTAAAMVVVWPRIAPREAQSRSAPLGSTAPRKENAAPNGKGSPPDLTLRKTAAEIAEACRACQEELSTLLAGPPRNMIPRMAAVVRRWVAVDPRGAIAFIEGGEMRDLLRRALMEAAFAAWLEFDVPDAASFLQEAVWRDERYADYLEAVFKALVRPASAQPYADLRAYLARLPQTEAAYRGVFGAIVESARGNADAAERFYRTLPAVADRGAFYSFLGHLRASAVGFAAVEQFNVTARDNEEDRWRLAGAINTFARSDDRAVLSRWLETQPAAAEFDYARAHLAVAAYRDDPLKALRIARQLSREEERLHYSGSFLEYWLRKDFAAAEAWAVASDLPTELVAQRIAKVTAPVPRIDYAAKMDATLDIADERERRRAQNAIQGWVQQDRAEALKWIDAHARTEAERTFFASLVRRTPPLEIGPVIILE